ncbi:MAG: TonB-dependent siderophore receptor [Campylobacter sp.]
MSKISKKRGAKFKAIGLSFALISAATQASLGADNADDNATATLEAIEVSTSADDGYRAVRSEVGKTNTPILEIPQTVNVVTQKVLQDKNAQNLNEALAGVSGISNSNSVGGQFDVFTKRGFEGSWDDGSILRNGVVSGVTNTFDATAESVEVLKGPASLFYGTQDPGGVINIVSKKPLYTPYYEVKTAFGNNKYRDLGFDFSDKIGDSGFAYRLVADYWAKDYWRDFGKYENLTVSPSISYKGDDYRIDLAYKHKKYKEPFDRGLFMLNQPSNTAYHGKFIDVSKKTRMTDYLEETKGKVDSVDLGVEKHFGENWLMKFNYGYSRMEHDYGQIRPSRLNPAAGTIRFIPEYQKGVTHVTHSGSLNLNGIAQWGEVAHNLLFGVDLYKMKQKRPVQYRGAPRVINIGTGHYGTFGRPTTPERYDQVRELKTLGIYAQDAINITDNLTYVAGLRYNYYDNLRYRYNASRVYSEQLNGHGDEMTYQTGLLYLLTSQWSIYTNYATSFMPQTSVGQNTTGEIKPEVGKSIEIGTKFQNDNITATMALFHINKNNVIYTDSNEVSTTTGKTQSQGLELDFSGRVTNSLTLTSSYTYTKTKTKKDEKNPFLEGKQLSAVPKHQASLFATYDFSTLGLKGLRIGAGARYLGSWLYHATNTRQTFKFGDATTFDAFVSYDTKILGRDASFQLNGKNITDKLYFASAIATDNMIRVIPKYGREVMFTVKVKF